jgi:hypothetical protein
MKLVLCLLLSLLLPITALAQEVPPPPAAAPVEEFALPETGDLVPLRRGTAAPRDGLLIDAEDMLRISQEYDRMRYLLTRTVERDREICDVRVEMERARLTACDERLMLRDDLWAARQTELVAQVTEARSEARRAAERGWFESPILWFFAGVIATGAVWIAVEATP